MNGVLDIRDGASAAAFSSDPECQSGLAQDDLRLIAMTFVATGAGVLLLAFLGDAALLATVVAGAWSLQTIPLLQIATALLPITLAFTALVAVMTGVCYLWAKSRLAAEPQPSHRKTRSSHGPYGFGFA